jgi:hypothetical protein
VTFPPGREPNRIGAASAAGAGAGAGAPEKISRAHVDFARASSSSV